MGVTYHALAWVDDGLITWDLTSGDRIVPIHTDLYMAKRCLNAIVHDAERGAFAFSLETTRDGFIEVLRSMPGIEQSWSLFRLVFPDEPVYFAVVSLILAPAK